MTDTKAKTQLPADLQPWEGSSSAVEQGKHWSSTLIWISAAIFGSALVWGFTARVDQTISVRGKLEPSGSVREVDSPSTGVVNQVLVKEGDMVLVSHSLFIRLRLKGSCRLLKGVRQ